MVKERAEPYLKIGEDFPDMRLDTVNLLKQPVEEK